MDPTASAGTRASVARTAAACASVRDATAPQSRASVRTSPSADVVAASAPSVVSLGVLLGFTDGLLLGQLNPYNGASL